MAYPPEPKKFDAVTIIGLAVAVAVLVFGQMHMAKKREQEQAYAQQQEAEQQRARDLKDARVRADAAATEVKADPANPKGPTTPADVAKPKKAVATPDIDVEADFIELVFSSKGATLKSARLPHADEDASKKDHKGLDILSEIVDGRRTFGISKLEIIPKGAGNRLTLDAKSGIDALDESIWSVKDSGSFDASGIRTVAYELALQDYTLTKTFTIYKTERLFRCDLAFQNRSQQDVDYFYELNGPQGILLDGPPADPKGGAGSRVAVQAQLAARDAAAQAPNDAEPEVKAISADGAKADSEEGRSVSLKENLWGAVKNRFFMATFVSLDAQQLVRIVASPIQNNDHPEDKRFAEPNIAVMGRRSLKTLAKGTAQSDPYALYLGPADDRHLDVAEAFMKKMMVSPGDYHLKMSIQFFEMFSWRWPRVDWLSRQMMWVFQGLHKLFGNFGIAVVLMTVLIKLCLHPLQRKTMVSMSKMQKLQPELNKIKKKYENATGTDAKLKMGMEQQEVMKKAGVNPTAGCLPMFIQAPVFSALYGIFNHAFDMRGAEFLWIKDLSRPDSIATLSFWPHTINLLPILYIVLSFIQTRMQPQTQSDDPQQEMNRKMMMFMPVFISFMFYSMPAGLVLYFAVSACWGMTESWYIKKFLIKDQGGPGSSTGGTPQISNTKMAVPKLAR